MSTITFRYISASAAVTRDDFNLAFINSLYAGTRRQGHGTGVMKMIIDWADRKDVVLLIVAQAYGQGDIPDNPSLIEFYCKFGFVDQPNTAPWPRHMIRRPSQELHGP